MASRYAADSPGHWKNHFSWQIHISNGAQKDIHHIKNKKGPYVLANVWDEPVGYYLIFVIFTYVESVENKVGEREVLGIYLDN